VIVLGAAVAPASAQYTMTWYEMSSGGGGQSTGGGYTLTGTIGQPDAGKLSGGYLTGGFMAPPRDSMPGCNPADLAEPYDMLNFSDVITFLTAYANMLPEADLADPIGIWSFSDIIAFLTFFGAGCP